MSKKYAPFDFIHYNVALELIRKNITAVAIVGMLMLGNTTSASVVGVTEK